MTMPIPTLEEFVADARSWLDDHAERAVRDDQRFVWGQGEFSVSVFHALDADDERALLEHAKRWTQAKAERGYHAIAAPGGVRRSRATRADTPGPTPGSSGTTSALRATRRTASRPG